MENVYLYLGSDMERKLLVNYIYHSDEDVRYFYSHSNIQLLYDFICENVEELEDYGFEEKDIEKISSCLYGGKNLLIINVRKGEKGYRLK